MTSHPRSQAAAARFALWTKRGSLRRGLVPGAIGLLASWGLIGHLLPASSRIGLGTGLWIVMVGLGVLSACCALIVKVIWPYLQPRGRLERGGWYLGSLLAAAVLIVVIPISPPPLPQWHHLQVIASGEKDPHSSGNGVWLTGFEQNNGTPVSVSEFELGPGWSLRDGVPYASQPQPAVLRWGGTLDEGGALRFYADAWSGMVEVRWDGETETLNLYRPEPADITVPLEHVPLVGANRLYRLSVWVGDISGLAVVLLAAALWLVNRPLSPVKRAPASDWSGLTYAVPSLVVWLLYWLAFWPAIMSYDSVDQWGQLIHGSYTDRHPAFHTLTYWLITRLWLSPAAAALAQIVLLSLVVGLGFVVLKRYRVPPLVLIIISGVVALSPANGLFAVTLWKDVFYSMLVLLLSILLLMIAHTHGRSLERPAMWVVLAVTAVLIALYRHEGPLVAFTTIGALAIAFGRFRWRLAGLLLFSIVAWALIRGPIYSAIGVEKRPPWFALQPVMRLVASYVTTDKAYAEELSAGELAYLDAIHPLDDGWQEYNCQLPALFVLSEETKRDVIDADPGQLVRIAGRLISARPDLFVRDLAQCNTLPWRVSHPGNGVINTATIGRDASGQVNTIIPTTNGLGLVPQPRLPGLRQFLVEVFFRSMGPHFVGVLWRPAWYFYLFVSAVVLAALRWRSWRYLWVGLPVVLAYLPFLVLPITPDFRFYFSAYLASLVLSVPLLFLQPAMAADTVVAARGDPSA